MHRLLFYINVCCGAPVTRPVYLTHLKGVYISFSFICKQSTQLHSEWKMDGVTDGKFNAHLKRMQTVRHRLVFCQISSLEVQTKAQLFGWSGGTGGMLVGRAAWGLGAGQQLPGLCTWAIPSWGYPKIARTVVRGSWSLPSCRDEHLFAHRGHFSLSDFTGFLRAHSASLMRSLREVHKSSSSPLPWVIGKIGLTAANFFKLHLGMLFFLLAIYAVPRCVFVMEVMLVIHSLVCPAVLLLLSVVSDSGGTTGRKSLEALQFPWKAFSRLSLILLLSTSSV